MKTALKIGLFVFWVCWVALFFWQAASNNPLMNAAVLALSAVMMVFFYFFYGVFLPAVVKVIWQSTRRRSGK